jgi:hypothetical protein
LFLLRNFVSVDHFLSSPFPLQDIITTPQSQNNEILSSVATWINLEDIIINEISQTQKGKYCRISLTCGI